MSIGIARFRAYDDGVFREGDRLPRISVIGTGYLGATHAACMAELGWEVIGVDVDAEKIAELARGRVPFHEPGLSDLLRAQLASRRLRFTTSYEEAAEFADIHFLCVNTPQQPGSRAADLRPLDRAVSRLAPLLVRECVVVGKSTVPVGTAARIAERLRCEAPAGHGVELAWNPEFLREGEGVSDTLRPDRLVVGVTSERAERVLRTVYGPLVDAGVPVVTVDLATAELAKTAANAFLATKLSFLNAVAEVCEVAGADVNALVRALSYDQRIGGQYLSAGLGFGGGCLPKDLRAFAARADELGVPGVSSLLSEVDAINLRARERTAELVRSMCGGTIVGRRVCVWGASFKPGSDDVRDSPALEVANIVHDRGGHVVVYDPVAISNAARSYPGLEFAENALGAAVDADVIVVGTDWPEFRRADPQRTGEVVARLCVVDGRNCLDGARWRRAGWSYRGLGLAPSSGSHSFSIQPPCDPASAIR
jgi:UDPglucose 6-dehydrogenase